MIGVDFSFDLHSLALVPPVVLYDALSGIIVIFDEAKLGNRVDE